jgi:hypothetical protein
VPPGPATPPRSGPRRRRTPARPVRAPAPWTASLLTFAPASRARGALPGSLREPVRARARAASPPPHRRPRSS